MRLAFLAVREAWRAADDLARIIASCSGVAFSCCTVATRCSHAGDGVVGGALSDGAVGCALGDAPNRADSMVPYPRARRRKPITMLSESRAYSPRSDWVESPTWSYQHQAGHKAVPRS